MSLTSKRHSYRRHLWLSQNFTNPLFHIQLKMVPCSFGKYERPCLCPCCLSSQIARYSSWGMAALLTATNRSLPVSPKSLQVHLWSLPCLSSDHTGSRTSYHTRASLLSPLLNFIIFHITFLENPNITLDFCLPLNPALLLHRATTCTHFCVESLETLAYKNAQLSISPLSHPDYTWFIAWSLSLSSTGSCLVGCAVISSDQVYRSYPFTTRPLQLWEMFLLTGLLEKSANTPPSFLLAPSVLTPAHSQSQQQLLSSLTNLAALSFVATGACRSRPAPFWRVLGQSIYS